LKIAILGSSARSSSSPPPASPDTVPPIFFRSSHHRRLMKLSIRIPYAPSIVTFWFLPKNSRKKISPLPHNLEFFWGSPYFFRRSHHRRLIKLGIRIPYAPSIVPFWFLPKNLRKKISPVPHNLEFFLGSLDFFDVAIIIG